MSFFDSLNTSATALTAQSFRMDIISQNMANIDTTRTAEGGPYKRKTVIFKEIGGDNNSFKSLFLTALSFKTVSIWPITAGSALDFKTTHCGLKVMYNKSPNITTSPTAITTILFLKLLSMLFHFSLMLVL